MLASVSAFALFSAWAAPAQAEDPQPLDTITITTIGRSAAKPRVGSAPAVAPAQAPQQPVPQAVAPSQPQQSAIDTLAPVSVITLNNIQTISAKRLSDIFYNVPGVSFQERGDSPESSINIRGLQDFGRVAVVVDGARQNYQRTGHNANGGFFLEPELLGGVEIVRGPTANVYGSGAIGCVVAFRTKDVDDILKPGDESPRHLPAWPDRMRGEAWYPRSRLSARIRMWSLCSAPRIACKAIIRTATAKPFRTLQITSVQDWQRRRSGRRTATKSSSA